MKTNLMKPIRRMIGIALSLVLLMTAVFALPALAGTAAAVTPQFPNMPTYIAGASITLAQASYIYDGRAKAPGVTVTLNGSTLAKDTDYTVAYSDNVNAGTATATVTGQGGYAGEATAQFTITPADIAGASVTLSMTSYPYSDYEGGGWKTPYAKVKSGSKILLWNKDFTVKYASNVKIGKATATVRGKGNFSGSKIATFQIVPNQVEVKKVTNNKKSAKVTWEGADQKMSGYQVRYRIKGNSNWGKPKSVSAKKLTYAIKNPKKGKAYQFQVRAYKKVSGANYYGAWSAPKVKVTFDANGGYLDGDKKNKRETVKYKTGQMYDYREPEYRKGYAFQGWYTKREGGRWVPEYERVTKKKNHTLYAHWAKANKGYPEAKFYAVDSMYKADLWPRGWKSYSKKNYRQWQNCQVRYYYYSPQGYNIDDTPLDEREAKGFKWIRRSLTTSTMTGGDVFAWSWDYIKKHADELPRPDFIPNTEAELEAFYDKFYAESRAWDWDDEVTLYVLCSKE
jgi:uncharacterized repeat protein (TIGR02543 family)